MIQFATMIQFSLLLYIVLRNEDLPICRLCEKIRDCDHKRTKAANGRYKIQGSISLRT
jgi:hypothetical protein